MSFWQEKTLDELTPKEWESLCDGCGRCCLQKLEDEDTGDIYYTNVVCRYIDFKTCGCGDYANRSKLVTTCIHLTPENVREINWLPTTCGYRLVAEGKDLPWWHPLVSGSKSTVHQAGISVRKKCLSDAHIPEHEWQDHLIDWVEI